MMAEEECAASFLIRLMEDRFLWEEGISTEKWLHHTGLRASLWRGAFSWLYKSPVFGCSELRQKPHSPGSSPVIPNIQEEGTVDPG